MKYKVRFYRQYEIDTTALEDALTQGRKRFDDDLKEMGKPRGMNFEYEIIFHVDRGPGYQTEKKTFDGGL